LRSSARRPPPQAPIRTTEAPSSSPFFRSNHPAPGMNGGFHPAEISPVLPPLFAARVSPLAISPAVSTTPLGPRGHLFFVAAIASPQKVEAFAFGTWTRFARPWSGAGSTPASLQFSHSPSTPAPLLLGLGTALTSHPPNKAEPSARPRWLPFWFVRSGIWRYQDFAQPRTDDRPCPGCAHSRPAASPSFLSSTPALFKLCSSSARTLPVHHLACLTNPSIRSAESCSSRS